MTVKMRWVLLLCLLFLSTSVGSKEAISFYCEVIAAGITANNSTCNITALLYEVDMRWKSLCIKIGVTNNAKNFLNIDGARYNVQNKERNGKRFIEKLRLENGV